MTGARAETGADRKAETSLFSSIILSFASMAFIFDWVLLLGWSEYDVAFSDDKSFLLGSPTLQSAFASRTTNLRDRASLPSRLFTTCTASSGFATVMKQ